MVSTDVYPLCRSQTTTCRLCAVMIRTDHLKAHLLMRINWLRVLQLALTFYSI